MRFASRLLLAPTITTPQTPTTSQLSARGRAARSSATTITLSISKTILTSERLAMEHRPARFCWWRCRGSDEKRLRDARECSPNPYQCYRVFCGFWSHRVVECDGESSAGLVNGEEFHYFILRSAGFFGYFEHALRRFVYPWKARADELERFVAECCF